ncbi:MAG: DUF7109 family protein [Halodesulfurarchaeum sp.]
MDLTGDDLAGILQEFGGLSPAELRQAIAETTFRAGEELPEEHIEAAVSAAIEEFSILPVAVEKRELLVAGPRAFPDPPEAAADLRHILEVSPREIPEAAREAALRERLENELTLSPGPERASELIEMTYDAEAWLAIDLSEVRSRLADRVEGES